MHLNGKSVGWKIKNNLVRDPSRVLVFDVPLKNERHLIRESWPNVLWFFFPAADPFKSKNIQLGNVYTIKSPPTILQITYAFSQQSFRSFLSSLLVLLYTPSGPPLTPTHPPLASAPTELASQHPVNHQKATEEAMKAYTLNTGFHFSGQAQQQRGMHGRQEVKFWESAAL